MSHYNDFETEITDQEALVRALCRCTTQMGQLDRNKIESHKEAKNLYGYHGDMREQKAHVIIRRKYVSGAANDIGFVKDENGKFKAIISDYDSNAQNHTWLTKLYTYYNVERSKMEFEARGIEYTESKDDKGRIQLRAKFKTEPTSRIQIRR